MPTIGADVVASRVHVPLAPVSGIQAAVTKLWLRFRTIRGEWPGDASVGLPLLRWFASPRVTSEEVRGLIRAQGDAIPGMRTVSVSATVGDTLSFAYSFQYTYASGRTVTGQIGGRLYAVDGMPAWFVASGAC